MKPQLPAYQPIDMETWPRREHFQYYREVVRCGYSLTARMDVTRILRFAHEQKKRFYGCMIYAAAKTVNSMDAMRMMVTPEGGAGIWQVSHPNFTVFHREDETFSDLWTEYDPSFAAFYEKWEQVLDTYGDRRGIKGRPDQPVNFFCISCVPWLDYTGYATNSVGDPALFPIITFGKYTKEQDHYTLPLTVTISHAASDGYHISQFFEMLQENLNRELKK